MHVLGLREKTLQLDKNVLRTVFRQHLNISSQQATPVVTDEPLQKFMDDPCSITRLRGLCICGDVSLFGPERRRSFWLEKGFWKSGIVPFQGRIFFITPPNFPGMLFPANTHIVTLLELLHLVDSPCRRLRRSWRKHHVLKIVEKIKSI